MHMFSSEHGTTEEQVQYIVEYLKSSPTLSTYKQDNIGLSVHLSINVNFRCVIRFGIMTFWGNKDV